MESLEDAVKDKENQLSVSQARLAALHADVTSSDSALSNMEESMNTKDKQIEKWVNWIVGHMFIVRGVYIYDCTL